MAGTLGESMESDITMMLKDYETGSYIQFSNVTKEGDTFSCFLDMKSDYFECHSYKFDFDNNIQDIIYVLNNMYNSFDGAVELRYRNEHEYLKFKINKLGQLFASGELVQYENWEVSQQLIFRFKLDQTSLTEMLNFFRKI